MSITYTVTGAATGAIVQSTNAVTLYNVIPAEWILVSESHDAANGLFEGLYHMVGSGKVNPVHLFVQSRYNGSETYNKVEMRTWVEAADDVTGLTTFMPQTFFLAWKHSGKVQFAAASCLAYMRALLGLFMADNAGTYKTASALRKLNDGNVDIVNDMFTDNAVN